MFKERLSGDHGQHLHRRNVMERPHSHRLDHRRVEAGDQDLVPVRWTAVAISMRDEVSPRKESMPGRANDPSPGSDIKSGATGVNYHRLKPVVCPGKESRSPCTVPIEFATIGCLRPAVFVPVG